MKVSGMSRHEVRDDTLLRGTVNIALDRMGIERRWVDVESLPGLKDLADQQSDGQRQRRHRLEIEQSLETDPADLLEIAHRTDTAHDCAEDNRGDHHLDQRDEAVAERPECNTDMWKVMTNEGAGGDGKQNLNIENSVPGAMRSGRGLSPPGLSHAGCEVDCERQDRGVENK